VDIRHHRPQCIGVFALAANGAACFGSRVGSDWGGLCVLLGASLCMGCIGAIGCIGAGPALLGPRWAARLASRVLWVGVLGLAFLLGFELLASVLVLLKLGP
jgi:hypothetical protein